MAVNSDFRQAFFIGQECWRNNDYKNARYWYEISIQDSEFKEKSLSKLIQIEIREGKYSKARKMLNENRNLSSSALLQVYGLLENVENKFEQSKRYYSMCMANPKMQYISLQALAKLYIQTGDYSIAEKMYEALLVNNNFTIQSKIGLICLYMLESIFLKAQSLLLEIDLSTLTPKLLQHFRILDTYIKYFLGQLKYSDAGTSQLKGYMTYRLFDKSDETLMRHIDRHKDQSLKHTNGCFFKYIDTKKLLYDARDIIQDMNGNHFEVSDMYRFRLDEPIGFKGDEITSDLCAVRLIGTKDIIKMYPVLLSDEFDKEGLSTSKELKLKRLQGGNKR